MRRGSIMCGGGVRSILLLPLVASCLETIDVCIYRMVVLKYVVVTMWGSAGKFVAVDVKDNIFFSLAVLGFVCVRHVIDFVFYVCIMRPVPVGARVWEV